MEPVGILKAWITYTMAISAITTGRDHVLWWKWKNPLFFRPAGRFLIFFLFCFLFLSKKSSGFHRR